MKYTREQIRRYFRESLEDAIVGWDREVAVECPFCDTPEVSNMSLFLDTGLWYCRSCKAAGDLLDFEERVDGTANSEQDAWERIERNMGIPVWLRGSIDENEDTESASESPIVTQARRYCEEPYRVRRWDIEVYTRRLRHQEEPLYRLLKVLRANTVFITTTKQDAEDLAKLIKGYPPLSERAMPACTAASGLDGRWNWVHGKFLTGKLAIVLAADALPVAGEINAIACSVEEYARKVKLVQLPGLKQNDGVSEWTSKHGIRQLLQLAKKADAWHSEGVGRVIATKC